MCAARALPAFSARLSQARLTVLPLLFSLALAACSETAASASGGNEAELADAAAPLPACSDTGPAVVFDVDETLTLSDEELGMQLQDPSYEPLPRDGGADLVSDYAALGYFVLYLTARSEEMILQSGEPVRDATLRWLRENGFPAERTRLSLAPTNAMVVGEPAAAYKLETLTTLEADGYSLDFAYGNADSDIAAYAAAGIDPAATFIIGERAGAEGTVAVPGESWVAHRESHVPTLDPVCVP